MGFELSLRHSFPNMSFDLSFSGGPGITVLFGPSGAGKTSVLRAFTGILTPHSGRATLNDTVLFDTTTNTNVATHKRRIGSVFQDGRLFPHLTALQNIRFGKPYLKRRASLIPEDALIDLLGLEALLHNVPSTLSGGEIQRVALARALNAAPDMLVMDEPLAALDGPRKDAILPYFDRLKTKAAIPILYVTHSVDELARLADNVVLMKDGEIVQHGSVYDVLSSPNAIPLLGVREAGSVLSATVGEALSNGLTRLDTSAGALELPSVSAQKGDTVRVRILAQDVILAGEKPVGLSARNILPAVILNIHQGRGPGAAVVLKVGDQTLLSRITDASRLDMGLTEGQHVFAILKASSIARPVQGE